SRRRHTSFSRDWSSDVCSSDLLATLGRNASRRLHGLQTLEGGIHHVHRVGGAIALGQNVLHASDFKDGAHGTTSDYAGTFGSRLHVHLGGAMCGLDRVLQGSAVQVDLDHVAASRFHSLLNGRRYFAGLATTETNTTLAITHHAQRGESEDTAAFNGLGNTINLYQLLDVAFVAAIVAIVAIALLLVICHNLELQPAFTSSIGQRFHTTVVLEARTVERNLGNA